MTIHLISVGKTILEFFARPDEHLSDDALVDQILRDKPAKLSGPVSDGLTNTWLRNCLNARPVCRELRDMCQRIMPGQWPSRVSAELSSLYASGMPPLALQGGDSAILLASDTWAGLHAALWNAVALTSRSGGCLEQIRYLPEVTPRTALGGTAGHVLIVRMLEMRVGTAEGFREAMRTLGLLGRHLIDTAQAGTVQAGTAQPGQQLDFCFHLSGGYKATIPYLIGLAEGLRSVEGGHHVDAYVLHETTEGAPIRLPLRRITPESVRAELCEGWNADGRRAERPRKGLLEGYAYEAQDDGWVLTAFGVGLRELIGCGPQSIGPR